MNEFKFTVPVSVFAIVFALAAVLNAGTINQESTRDLGSQPAAGKFLTFGEVDSWVLDAAENEVLIVRVTTSEFDAVLGLASVESDEYEVLFSRDEEGSNSRFRHRIQKSGKYKIRVHGYEMKGGGNYQLSVQRYVAQPLAIGTPAKTKVDEQGDGSFFFDAEPGQWLTLVDARSGRLFDPEGELAQPDWRDAYHIKIEGEYLVVTTGIPESDLSLEVRPASVGQLGPDSTKDYETNRGTLHNWEIDSQKGQFALVTVSRKNNPESRMIFSPPTDPNEKPLDSNKEFGPEFRLLPVASKGSNTTYAVVFGRTGKFLLQTRARRETNIKVTMTDPTIDLTSNRASASQLPVGGSAYYGFDASAGDLVKFSLRSDSFDSVLRLFDGKGVLVSENDDFGDSTNSEVEYLVPEGGYYRWQVVSLGNGGGGDYEFDFVEIPKRDIAIGQVASGRFEDEGTEYWSLKIDSGKPVYVNVRSSVFTPKVMVYAPVGRVISNNSIGVGNESLIPLTRRGGGRVTIAVSSRGIGGRYDIRVIDGGWGKKK